MHPNPAFRRAAEAQNLDFAHARGFGTLAVNGTDAPLLSHIPFFLDTEAGTAAFHLVRSNPIARLDSPQPAVLSVLGPDGYISPDWYGAADQVPTWNYVAVHLRGRIEPLPDSALRPHLDAVSAHFESHLAPKQPWRTEKMAPEPMTKMMRQILPFRLVIDTVDGTWKLNQNKDDNARLGAADAVEQGTPGQETTALARLMRDA